MNFPIFKIILNLFWLLATYEVTSIGTGSQRVSKIRKNCFNSSLGLHTWINYTYHYYKDVREIVL